MLSVKNGATDEGKDFDNLNKGVWAKLSSE